MAKGRLILMLSLFILPVFISAFASAEISLSQPKELYNLDDALQVALSIKESYDTSGILRVSVVCPSNTIVFYAKDISLHSDVEESFDIEWSRISDITGQCYIEAEFESDSVKSEKFVITDRIDANIEISKEHFLPGEELGISGTAVKANSQKVDGFAEISIPSLIEKQFISVSAGRFELEINLPSDAVAKEYELQAYIFEKNSKGKKTNNGFVNAKLFISPVPTSLDVSLNDEEFMPGDKIVVKPSLYDQAAKLLEEEISVQIRDSAGKLVLDKVVGSGQEIEYLLAANSAHGDWQVKAEVLGFDVKRFVYVKEYAAISAYLQEDGILVVRNIGNVPYQKPLEIRFINEEGEQLEVKNLNLGVGEDTEFKLTAPAGVYDVEAGGTVFLKVPLTGLAAGAIELEKKDSGILMQYPLLSFFVFILFVLLVVMLSHGIKQNPLRVVADVPRKARMMSRGERIQQIKDAAFGEGDRTASKSLLPVRKAQSSLVLKGVKQRASVLSFKIKNLAELKHKLSRIAFDSLASFAEKAVISESEEQKGAVHKVSGSEFLVIFSPNLKQFRHEVAAAKAAAEIEKGINEFNSRRKEKIEYGIGVNSGELVVNIKEVMFYTGIGRTIVIAKKIADNANREVLVSKNVQMRASPEIKTQKACSFKFSGEDVEVYSIKQISGREVYKPYVMDILERIKRDEQAKTREKN